MTFPKVGKIAWTVIIGIGVVGAAIGSLFLVEDRYAKAKDLVHLEREVEEDVDHKLILVENKTIKTFESYQMKQQTVNIGLQLQILNVQYDSLTDRYYTLKREMRKYPQDNDLRNEFQEVSRQRANIADKRSRLLNQSSKVGIQ